MKIAYTALSFAPAVLAWAYGAPLLTMVCFAYAAGVVTSLIIWTIADGL